MSHLQVETLPAAAAHCTAAQPNLLSAWMSTWEGGRPPAWEGARSHRARAIEPHSKSLDGGPCARVQSSAP